MSSILGFVLKNWRVITALCLTLITLLSLWPISTLPDVPGSDKTHHFVAYSALMFPLALRKPKYWVWGAWFFFFWSGGIELIQPYVNRYGEWLDLAANAAGLLIGWLLAVWARRVIRAAL